MAAEPITFDDLAPVEDTSTNDDDEPTRKLEPGDELVAQIRHIEKEVGQFENDLLHLTDQDGELFKFWSNNTVSRKLEAANAKPGDTIGVRKAEDATTFTVENDDGEEEERESYDFEVGVLEHGGD